jgi:uncharacterized protein
MGKLILFVIIIFGVYYLFFRKKDIKNDTDELILCERCKTFYPQDEIININGKNICKDCYANSK